MEEFNPNNKLQALVHVMVPKNGTLQWECMPNAHFAILLEAAYDYSSVGTLRNLDRGTDEFIECWRTVAEVSEYVHRFHILTIPSCFLIDEIMNGIHPAKIDGKIVDEIMKYPRKQDKLLYGIARGLNSGYGQR